MVGGGVGEFERSNGEVGGTWEGMTSKEIWGRGSRGGCKTRAEGDGKFGWEIREGKT